MYRPHVKLTKIMISVLLILVMALLPACGAAEQRTDGGERAEPTPQREAAPIETDHPSEKNQIEQESHEVNALDKLKFADTIPSDESFALINPDLAFLALDEDGETLKLFNQPCLWRLCPGETGYQIVLDRDRSQIFDLYNADYSPGTAVHLYVETGDPSQYWNLTPFGDGFLITSAQYPEWCVMSRERGFVLGKADEAESCDVWMILPYYSGIEELQSPAAPPFLHRSFPARSYSPTPEFWELFDQQGISETMISQSVHYPGYCAQYLSVYPELSGTDRFFDFFAVDFYTDSQPDYTYWSLVNWDMDSSEYMRRNHYTSVDAIGAYAGVQDVGDHTTGITSVWESNFYRGDQLVETIVPTCLYPNGQSTQFSNEGSGTSLVTPMEWNAGRWYRFVLRSWEHGDSTYIGTWLEDLSSESVQLIAVYDTHLPHSCLTGAMYQFLEDFGDLTCTEYRQMQLSNYCLRSAKTQQWFFLDTVSMSIWADLGFNQGTYRYRAANGVFVAETCGIGEDACAGMTESDTAKTLSVYPSADQPDPDHYPIPDLS